MLAMQRLEWGVILPMYAWKISCCAGKGIISEKKMQQGGWHVDTTFLRNILFVACVNTWATFFVKVGDQLLPPDIGSDFAKISAEK